MASFIWASTSSRVPPRVRRYAFVAMTLLRGGRPICRATAPPAVTSGSSGWISDCSVALLEQQTIELPLELRNALKLQLKFPQRVGER